jgi:small subunit ribosomal protein S3e
MFLMPLINCFQDVLGIKVKIMLDWHPKGKQCPTTPLPDLVTIHQPKEEGYMRPSVLATEIPLEIEVPVLAA